MGLSITNVLKLFLFLFTLSGSAVQILSDGVGINYGQIANNLPSPARVSVMLRSLNISRVKLYDTDPNVLYAFSNTDVDFIVGLGNEYLENMTDPIKAQSWIQQRLQPHLPQTRITSILVGNEVFKSNDAKLYSNLLPAMQSVYRALVGLGLEKQVTVTTAHSLDILANSYPPSAGTFREDLAVYIQPLLDFHAQIKSPFLVNAYPYFAYKDSPNEVSLDYVLFQPNQGTTDPNTNLKYDNMISETGWPSKGDADEAGATPENAELYNGNLLKKIVQRQGTPGKPSVPVDIYVFALFNENLKPGPASERNYGLFYPNGNPVYNIGLQGHLPEIAISPSSSSSSFKINILPLFSLLICAVAYLLICA
ncbi:putative Glucan endo-1,3-beta-glucosidase [Melia azedarach]|uniref:Glucan endo-1,3-beta-glucosidase n=1 Tax=Melia azedarach TaxID=155640 RepID=A0ACC1YM05_MELAZ|nr:putative Glucan endo-1,3-beta-glucosidase [Melia azedarach]